MLTIPCKECYILAYPSAITAAVRAGGLGGEEIQISLSAYALRLNSCMKVIFYESRTLIIPTVPVINATYHFFLGAQDTKLSKSDMER